MVYSSLQGETIELPMDGAAWETKLKELAANSNVRKKMMQVSTDDFASSFKK
jgi:hypothetical protein